MKKIFNIENIIMLTAFILFIYELINFKSYSNKIIIIFFIFLFIQTILKKNIAKNEKLLIFVGILYSMIFFIKNLKYKEVQFYPLFMLLQIFLFSYFIFCFANKERKNENIIINSISIIMTIINILENILKVSYIPINIAFIFFFILRDRINKINKKYVIILDIIIGIISINNNLLISIFLVLLYIKNIFTSSTLKTKVIYVILILFLVTFSFINIIPKEEKASKYGVNNIYKFPSTNLKEYESLKMTMKNRSLLEKIIGVDYKNYDSLKNNDLIMNNSIVYNYLYLGIVGFIIYLATLIYFIRKYTFISYENILLVVFTLMSPLILKPFIAYILAKYLTTKKNKKVEKASNCDLIIACTTIIILTIGISLIIINKQNKTQTNNNNIVLNIQNNIQINKPYKLKLLEEKNIEYDNINDNLKYLSLNKENKTLAFITFVERKIDDVEFQFITIKNGNNKLAIELDFLETDLNIIETFDKYNIEREYSTLVGIDKLQLPIGYYSSNESYYIIGKSFIYNTLTSQYNDIDYSTIYELISQNNDFANNKKNLEIPKNTNLDTYIIKSNQKLLNDDNSIKSYINITNQNSSWYTYRGNNYKLQYSIDPFTRDGYGKILGRLIEEEIYEERESDSSRLFKALSDNAIHNLYYHTAQNKAINGEGEGVWLTNYTSTWLSKDYGIKSFYVDTRYNETIGYLLLNLYQETKKEKYLKSFLNYADFIIEAWKEKSYLVDGNRILPDYFSNNQYSNTHSSLNHQLALINYLFKAYEETNDKEYYNIAKEILNGLISFKNKWIRENKDLWYEINNKGEFIGNDYEIVTLDDLLFTQNYLFKYEHELNEQLTIYIKSKLSYLNSKEIKIPSSTQELIKKLNIN